MKISHHIGINKYNPTYYGKIRELKGCVNDSKYMNDLATANGYLSSKVINASAISNYFVEYLTRLSEKLVPGDNLLISFSGHGTKSEIDGKMCNGLCFYDRILWDYEIKAVFAKFRKGVNLIWITDCCFAEENFRFVFRQDGDIKFINTDQIENFTAPKNVTWQNVFDIKCNLIQYASSSQFQVSYDLAKNGLFTEALRSAVRENPTGNYYKIFQLIERNMAKTGYPQTPKFIVLNGNDIKLTYRNFLL